MKLLTVTLIVIVTMLGCRQQPPSLTDGWWRASLLREDGNSIDFNIEVQHKDGQPVWHIRNAGERMKVDSIQWQDDSLLVQMPLFESVLRLHYEKDGLLRGVWIKGTSTKEQVMPVVITANQPDRYPVTAAPAYNITGRWAVTLTRSDKTRKAVAEFSQNGNQLTGTVLTPTGDYRYLEGVVNGDTLQLSTFDGNHAYYFKALVQNDTTISNGWYYSGATYSESWTAVKDADATVPDSVARVYLREGEDSLHFRFPDLDSNMVSIHDERFHNKAVIVQIMGSWCPNCMDETAFLSDYYENNKQRGVEMVALAYEYSTDFQRSQKSLRKLQQRFNIQYPMLITGVRTGDSLRTEKTLPELTPIRMFPTTIFIGRDGKVKSIHTGFMGPGTGEHYEAFKKEFNATVDELLKG